MKTHMKNLSFTNIYNEKEDFYNFAEQGRGGPGDYDLLMTNPPYSANHVHRLFKYCVKSKKPFCLLLPHYFYTEPYYKETIGAQDYLSNLFFICPGLGRRYGYTPPTWQGIEREDDGSSSSGIAPFPSFWYCNLQQYTKPVIKKWKVTHEPKLKENTVASRLSLFQLHVFLARTTGDLPNEMKSEFDMLRKRPNPKARKKMAKVRQGMMKEGEVFVKKVPSAKAAEWRQKAQVKIKQAKEGK